jgi:propanol-preferring alcohol dehydrogenase
MRLGAAWTGGSEDKAPDLLDAAIVFAPAGKLALNALDAVRKGGTVALAGISMSPIPQMDYGHIYHERILRSVTNMTRHDAHEFLELAADVPVQTEVELFQLNEANLALTKLKKSEIRGAAVLKVQ